MRSLRGTLVLGTSLASTVLFTAAGVFLYLLLRSNLVAQVDRALLEKARLIASNIEVKGPKLKLEVKWATDGARNAAAAGDTFSVWGADGTLAYSVGAPGDPGILPFHGTIDSPEYRWISLSSGLRGRALGLAFQPEQNEEEEHEGNADSQPEPVESLQIAPRGLASAIGPLTLVVERDVTPLESTLADMRLIVLAVSCAAAGVSVVVMVTVIGHSLRPLGQLSRDISLLNADDLSARIEAPNLPRELLPTVSRLNELLGRLERAFERERAFSGDIAHELRTPLAGLRSTIDVTLARSRQPHDYQDAMSDCQQIVVQLQRLVETLLALTRLEAGGESLEFERHSLHQLVHDEWSAFAAAAAAGRLRIEWALDADRQVDIDAGHWSLVLRNLFSNAVAHANSGGWVRIGVNCLAREAVLTVTNSGSSVAQEDAENVFSRFWRGDASRSNVGVHFGLGLPLVKRIVTALGGTIRVQTAVGGNFSVTVKILLAEAPARGQSMP